ncbi:MAG TPA: pseudouridine synthase [Vicinamibacterales bacterium]|nr:pseudouridine synthase [Vicinamibacterales bacterium]
MERLQKLLSIAGVASRRAAEELITQGRVEVNGQVVRTLGSKAEPTKDVVKVDGRRLRFDVRPRYILMNKPRGVVTTRKDPERRRTVIELLARVREYVYPVGRLDYDSEGLLLLTSDGDLAARLTHPGHAVERVYEAIVVGAPAEEDLERLRRGLFLDGARTAPAEVRRGGTADKGSRRGARDPLTKLIITLREGRNRQVRRMCSSIGHPVRKLTRTRMGPITLGALRPGQWRDLTPKEVEKLKGAAS